MNKLFPILAIETSGDLCSVSVMIDVNYYTEVNINQKHVHSEKIFDIIDYTIKNCDVDLKDFAQIAISIGPGSFTGLRIGLSAAKGLALGCNLPIVAVPTLDALALEISEKLNNETKFIIFKTAGIDDLYYAIYKTKNCFFEKLTDVSLINKNQLTEVIKEVDIIFVDKNFLTNAKLVTAPRATYIARWAYLFGKELLTFDYDYLEPYYLKQFIAKVKK